MELPAPHGLLPPNLPIFSPPFPQSAAPGSPPSAPASSATSPRSDGPSEPELRAVLAKHAGNVAAVGRELGKERMQIHRWLKKFGISLDDYRG